MVSTLGPSTLVLSQCSNQITILPLRAMKAASKARDFVSYRYSLSASDSLLIRSHEDTETSIGPYDTGFVITRDGKTTQSVMLRKLPKFRREDLFFSEAFTTVSVTRACESGEPIYFVSMKYMGDELSPALAFVVIPAAQRYQISALPMFSGGTVEISTADPLHLRVWSNLNEGMCNACKTPYQITTYEIRDGNPVQIRQQRSRHTYGSDQFPELRIRFIP